MLSPLPRRSGWAYCFAHSPSRISLPRKGCRVGLRIVLFEACSAFTRVTACTRALSPIRDTLTRGFSHFVTSMTAPVASGWSGCRVGLTPTRKRRLSTAHTRNGHWVWRSDRDRHFASRSYHGAHSTGEWPIGHGVSRRAFDERGESGIRNILKPAISGNPSAASADTKART